MPPSELANHLVKRLQSTAQSISCAESLTGGKLVSQLIDIPGASLVVKGGICAYSFEAKHNLLGIDLAELQAKGAVRAQVAAQMSLAALDLFNSNYALATTGVAGPGADEHGNPEGLVYIALASSDKDPIIERYLLAGSREQIRSESVRLALKLLASTLNIAAK